MRKPWPNFFIVGAPRCGSTTLHACLRQHPDVFMPTYKEPTYFAAADFEHQTSRYAANWPVAREVDYLDLFAGVRGESAVGEASVLYLFSRTAAVALQSTVPKARLIVILRQPADRAYASYLAHVREGIERCPTFEAAFRHEQAGYRRGWTDRLHLARSCYAEGLARYYELFSPDQIRVLLFDDLKRDLAGLLRGVFEFLDVDANVVVDTTVRRGATGLIRNPVARYVWARSAGLRAQLRAYIPFEWRERALRLLGPLDKPPLDPGLRAEVTEWFRDDISKLEGLLSRDLSEWRHEDSTCACSSAVDE